MSRTTIAQLLLCRRAAVQQNMHRWAERVSEPGQRERVDRAKEKERGFVTRSMKHDTKVTGGSELKDLPIRRQASEGPRKGFGEDGMWSRTNCLHPQEQSSAYTPRTR
jgi:hypothetical protein